MLKIRENVAFRVGCFCWLLIGFASCGVGRGTAGSVGGSGGGRAAGIGGVSGGPGQSAGADGGSAAGGAAGISDGAGGAATGGAGGAAQGGAAGGSTSGAAGVSTGDHGGASSGGTAGSGVPADFDELYEAEAIPPNQIFGYAMLANCAQTCKTPLVPGANCCSGGGEVTWIVSKNGAHPSGWMQFNGVEAPADGTFDVTFWYHCGGSDTYGDNDCGGQTMTEPAQFGCRPHVFTIDGMTLPGAYHFPCFNGAQSTIHAATVSLPLTKGTNTLEVAPPPPRDSVDVDAIEILPLGKGRAPHVTVNTTDLLGKK